jgi:hypothetical protein
MVPAAPALRPEVFGVPNDRGQRMLETEKPFSPEVIEMRASRKILRPVLLDEFLSFFLLVVGESSLVLVLKTPEMTV